MAMGELGFHKWFKNLSEKERKAFYTRRAETMRKNGKNKLNSLGNKNASGKLSEEAKRRMSEARKRYFANGGKHWAKGLTKNTSEHIAVHARKRTGQKRSWEVRRRFSEIKIKAFYDMYDGNPPVSEYPSEFNRLLKDIVKSRDCYCCQLCWEEDRSLRSPLSVHHIDYDKFNCNLNNLISLCRSCHQKTNSNRDSWPIFFRNNYLEQLELSYE